MTNRTIIPSMTALRAFEAAARLKSVTRAAEELGRTQGAVSRQIAHLEDQLGLLLFDRVRQQLVLTDLGREYLHDVTGILDRVKESTRRITSRNKSCGRLNLAVAPSFSSRWLMPRLPRFAKLYPQIYLDIMTKATPFDFHREQIDLAIDYGEGEWGDAIVDPLMEGKLIVVCSPTLKPENKPVAPSDWPQLPLLQQSSRREVWDKWFAHLGLSHAGKTIKAEFEHLSMIVDAACSGLGFAIVPELLIEEELADGSLLKLASFEMGSAHRYFLAYSKENERNLSVRAFRDWIKSETGPAYAAGSVAGSYTGSAAPPGF